MRATKYRIIVEPLPLPSIQNGLHLVQKNHPSAVGSVVSVGSFVSEQWPELKAGDMVAIKPMGGVDFEFSGHKFKLMDRSEVLAIME